MSAPTTQVPARLQRAVDAQRRWGEAGVHLVPIRHHSPACALALSALLEEVRPATVLIEGPVEYADLLPSLQDPRTVPPVALLSLGERTASYYPLAEFSPETAAPAFERMTILAATLEVMPAAGSPALSRPSGTWRARAAWTPSPGAWVAVTTTRSGSTSSRTGPPPTSDPGGTSSPTPWHGRDWHGSTSSARSSIPTAPTPARPSWRPP